MSPKYHYYYHGVGEQSGCFLAVLFFFVIGLLSTVLTFLHNYGLIILAGALMILAICKTVSYKKACQTEPASLVCSVCGSNNTRIFQKELGRKTKQYVKCSNCGFVWDFQQLSDINRKKTSSKIIAIISYVISIVSILLYVYLNFIKK